MENSHSKPLEVSVENFGPIAEGKIELRQLTVFVGPSNTGKSYMAALIYALHRLFGSFTRDNEYFSVPEELWGEDRIQRIQGFKVDLTDGDIAALDAWLNTALLGLQIANWQKGSIVDVPETVASTVRPFLDSITGLSVFLDSDIARCFGVDPTIQLARYSSGKGSGFSLGSGDAAKTEESDGFLFRISLNEQGATLEPTFPRTLRCRLSQGLIDWSASWHNFAVKKWEVMGLVSKSKVLKTVQALADGIVTLLGGPCSRPAHYLPADRGGIMHAHQLVLRSLISDASRPRRSGHLSRQAFSGIIGDFLVQLVSLAGSATNTPGKGSYLARQLEQEVLLGEIQIEGSETSFPTFSYRPREWEHELGLMSTSSMVSELAPIVLYLRHVVQIGDLLIIEEPESHLHPEMQAKITRLLVAAVQSGIRILITTHSEWILEELANLVRLSDLPIERREGIEDGEIALCPDQLGAWFFEPDEKKGGSVVREISLDEESATFPAGFGLVTESLYNRWVEISTRIQEE